MRAVKGSLFIFWKRIGNNLHKEYKGYAQYPQYVVGNLPRKSIYGHNVA